MYGLMVLSSGNNLCKTIYGLPVCLFTTILLPSPTQFDVGGHPFPFVPAGFDLDGENKAKGLILWKLQSPHVRAFHVSLKQLVSIEQWTE